MSESYYGQDFSYTQSPYYTGTKPMTRTASSDSAYESMGSPESPFYDTGYHYPDASSGYYLPQSTRGYSTTTTTTGEQHQQSYLSAPYSADSKAEYCCLFPGCSTRFGRSADLARHITQVHNPSSSREQYLCDYGRCPRKETEPFHRKDHFRDHLREYHKEDLHKRSHKGYHGSSSGGGGSGSTSGWLDDRNIHASWWRCSKCLERNKMPALECSKCGMACERERIDVRSRMGMSRSRKDGR